MNVGGLWIVFAGSVGVASRVLGEEQRAVYWYCGMLSHALIQAVPCLELCSPGVPLLLYTPQKK